MSEDDFKNWEYSFDLSFYYVSPRRLLQSTANEPQNNGFGSPVGAAQGLGYLQTYIDRLSGSYTAATGDSAAMIVLVGWSDTAKRSRLWVGSEAV